MKSMKLWMGAVAAAILTTGCGSSSPCEEIGSSVRDTAKRISSCGEGQELTDEQVEQLFDTEACESKSESACTEEEAEVLAEAFSCVFGKMTCSNMEDDEAFEEDLAECEKNIGDAEVRESCFEAMFPINDDIFGEQVMRKALKLPAAQSK